MKLGITSDCIHYKNEEGLVGTENHILLRQLEQLASHFESTTIVCPFTPIDDTKVISWYKQPIQFIEVPNVGGKTLLEKLQIFTVLSKWIKAFRKVNGVSDILYQRFPNNLNIPGFFYFYFKRKKVFATYTGSWLGNEPFTYRLQKWLLKKLFRGPVWVYITGQDVTINRIKPGFSPSYTEVEWNEETRQVNERIASVQKNGLDVFRLISVGKLIDYKNQLTILKACVILKGQQFPFTLKVVGDGPMYNELADFISQNKLEDCVELAGKKNYQQLRELYRQSDFVLQAPLKEGFGKVPIEGLFHGAVPVLNHITMAGYMAGEREERGFLFDASNPKNIADKLIEIKNKISLLPKMIENGREFAKKQTLESWANEYHATVSEFYKKS